jgi:hypothetical protein
MRMKAGFPGSPGNRPTAISRSNPKFQSNAVIGCSNPTLLIRRCPILCAVLSREGWDSPRHVEPNHSNADKFRNGARLHRQKFSDSDKCQGTTSVVPKITTIPQKIKYAAKPRPYAFVHNRFRKGDFSVVIGVQ